MTVQGVLLTFYLFMPDDYSSESKHVAFYKGKYCFTLTDSCCD